MKRFLQILLIIFPVALFAQDYPLTGHFQNLNEKDIYYSSNSTLIRPATGVENEIYESLIYTTAKDSSKSWLNRKLFHEHFVVQEDEHLKLLLDPIVDFRINKSINSFYHNPSFGYLNTRGILINGNLDSKVFFNTSFFENQGVFPDYINEYYETFGVIPGYGRVKPLSGFNEYDFAAAYGNISFKANERIDFTIGYDRLFIGDGYRSMILSDYAAPMMYLKSSVKFGRFEYNNIFTKAINPNFNNVIDLDQATNVNSLYPSKFISYNTLTYNLNSAWQFSLLEALVMSDELPNWKVPLYTISPFFRTAYIDKSNLTNNLIGTNITWQNQTIGIFYAQAILDNWNVWNEPIVAMQFGYKSFNFLNVKNLYLQLEYNMTNYNAYKNTNNGLHYGHYNQPLAHPAGSDFDEFLMISAFTFKRFELLAKINFLKVGTEDIFDYYPANDYSAFNSSTSTAPWIVNSDFQIIYYINRVTRLQVFVGINPRIDFIRNADDCFIQAGLRTAIRSNYYDF